MALTKFDLQKMSYDELCDLREEYEGILNDINLELDSRPDEDNDSDCRPS